MKSSAIGRSIAGSFNIGFPACFAVALLIFAAVGTRGQEVVEVETAASSAADVTLGAGAFGVSVPVSERVEVLAYGVQVRGRGVINLAAVDARIRVNEFLDITPSYLGLFLPKVNGIRNYNHRARLSATLNFKLGKLQISDRNLVERRFRRSNSTTRYRNGFELQHPVTLSKKIKFDAYARAEPTYDFQAKQITQTLVRLGARKTFAKKYTFDLLYARQFDRNGADANVFVLAFIVRLPKLSDWK